MALRSEHEKNRLILLDAARRLGRLPDREEQRSILEGKFVLPTEPGRGKRKSNVNRIDFCGSCGAEIPTGAKALIVGPNGEVVKCSRCQVVNSSVVKVSAPRAEKGYQTDYLAGVQAAVRDFYTKPKRHNTKKIL